jgi:hypothetical protein
MSNRFEEVLSKIKDRGYYRIVFRPTTFDKGLVKHANTLKEFVEQSQIKLRGASFPFIESNTIGGIHANYLNNDMYESWTEAGHNLEVWRFYQSGQFVNYVAFREDWFSESKWLKGSELENVKPKMYLDAIGIIYEITEMLLFLANLATKIDGGLDFEISVSLHNLSNRKLTTFDLRRMSFHFNYVVNADTISKPLSVYTRSELSSSKLEIAEEIIKNVYAHFNWQNYSASLIETEQQKLIERNL